MKRTTSSILGICVIILSLAASQACKERTSPETRVNHAKPVELNARFEAYRIFVDVPIQSGDTLSFFTDTGGGLFVLGDAIDRIGWSDSVTLALRGIAVDTDFPEPLGTADRRVPIYRPEKAPAIEFGDGMLGQAWFADRVWTFDYPKQKLLLHQAAPELEAEAHKVALGFRNDSTGARLLSFPRIAIVVDGDSLDMLLDTGATVYLSAETQRELNDGSPAVQATSFITSKIFERWTSRHPQWPVIQNADENVAGMAMIRVPEVTIADFTIGPVWFTERPDANFHEYMSQWMDRPVEGAIGGNAFRFFKIVMDYPAAKAHFMLGDNFENH
jgi:hypothetical protein